MMSFGDSSSALILSSSLSFVWLWLWLREDRAHPEPRSRIALAFVGGMISVVCALLLETWVEQMSGIDPYQRTFLWSAIEEIVKWGAMWITAYRTSIFDEPIDALMYAITVALGFATFENMLFIVDSLSAMGSMYALKIALVRFIGATLLHVAASGVVGMCIGLAWSWGKRSRQGATVIGLGVATILHSIFNLWVVQPSSTQSWGTFSAFVLVWGTIGVLLIVTERLLTPPLPQS